MPLLLFDNAWGILTWSLVVFLELIFKQQPRPFCKQKVRAYLENKGVVLALLCVYTEPYIANTNVVTGLLVTAWHDNMGSCRESRRG